MSAEQAAYAALVERFVASHYPRAAVAIMAGSTARGERTPTSDIDLLLIGESLFEDPEQTSIATCTVFEDEVLEIFAYTSVGFEEWAGRDVNDHQPVIVNMLLDGIPVRDDGLDELRAPWSRLRDAGPVVDTHDLDMRRYFVTDVLDDLRDATDPAERHVLAASLFERIAQVMLLSNGRWLAAGKHLPRALRTMDAERAEKLLAPLLATDYTAFADAAEAELDRAGGRVQDGFVR